VVPTSTAGALLWTMTLVYAGTLLGAHGVDIRKALPPFDMLILVVVAGFAGRRLLPRDPSAEASSACTCTGTSAARKSAGTPLIL
jgi:membrane protein DedA with SNARE-associated domain